jgi:hypothetical protein
VKKVAKAPGAGDRERRGTLREDRVEEKERHAAEVIPVQVRDQDRGHRRRIQLVAPERRHGSRPAIHQDGA